MAGSDDAPARARKICRLTKSVAQLIVDSRVYFDAEARRGRRDDVTKPLKRAAACLGVSETFVKKACRLDREGEDLPSDTEKEPESGNVVYRKLSSKKFAAAFSPCTPTKGASRWIPCCQSSRGDEAQDVQSGCGVAQRSIAS